MCFIDQAWGQDGWILADSFFCVIMDQNEVSVRKNAKERLVSSLVFFFLSKKCKGFLAKRFPPALIRIKKDLFLSRAGKRKQTVFVAQWTQESRSFVCLFFLFWLSSAAFLRALYAIPCNSERKRWAHLTHSGSRSKLRIRFILFCPRVVPAI